MESLYLVWIACQEWALRPFQDRLRWQDFVPTVNCGNQKVCVESST
jgi:hypothetical protein